jgi:SnoaL-like domain
MDGVTTTSVVEQLLDHAANGRWEALEGVLDPAFEIVEPESLPYGGVHRGVSGYIALMQRIGRLFELDFEPLGLHALDGGLVLLRMIVTFTARASGRSVRVPVVEILRVERGLVARSEVYLADPAALLATLG